MKNETLRLEQYETVRYDLNCNPFGVPKSVTNEITQYLPIIGQYPDTYYEPLKNTIAEYAGCDKSHLVLGSGLSDLLRLFIALQAPKKALILSPTATEYEKVLSIYGCAVDTFQLDIASDFRPEVTALIAQFDESYDMVIIGNPNNPTSQILTREEIEKIAKACKEHDIYLLIDEMYIEFTDKYEEITSVPLVADYDNLVILRSISKFFSVPGLRLAYAIMNNETNMAIINMTATPNNISVLTAVAVTAMLKDRTYIRESKSTVYTERNLIFSAMNKNRKIRLVKPYANYLLMEILDPSMTAADVLDHCRQKGLILRNCHDFNGLNNKFVRFSVMNPSQNDLLVNTILDLFT